jgi:methylenetetrahydrofolate--tRNA-(uracil-5-)-methyltransferase
MSSENNIHIVGGGLAGCEAAHQISKFGIKSYLYEMRPIVTTEVHKTNFLAELVCSNSFRSDDKRHNAVGVLHEELRMSDSLIMKAADNTRIPAGSALAVDREKFSKFIDQEIRENPLIELVNKEITSIKNFKKEQIIIATGPLTSSNFSKIINKLIKEEPLDFFDAIAPIVYKESINMNIAWKQSRYDKGNGDDYINCPLTKEEYYDLLNTIIKAPKIEFKEFENTPYFEGCMPIEEMIRRGSETLRFGPLKPVGLTNPNSEIKPYAVVQLRQDNKIGTLYNMVGFQTKMKHSVQKEVLQKIPALKNAKFARLGGLHRNTFINSPRLLDEDMRLNKNKNIYFAGQITGVEGYVESCSIGNLVGRIAAHDNLKKKFRSPPDVTAHGSLIKHLTKNANPKTFQPMNINFGLMSSINYSDCKNLKGKERKEFMATKAINSFKKWIKTQSF